MTKSTPADLSPHRAYHRGNVAEDLRRAAERILANESLEDITVRRLVREVGVSPASFYNHFENLDDLLLSIATSSLRRAAERATAVWTRPGTRADLLTASATDFIKFCLRNRQLMRFMLTQRQHDDRDHRPQPAGGLSFEDIVGFIYGDRTDAVWSAPDYERYGVAVGYIALTYGFAITLAEARSPLDLADDAQLDRFVRSGILPFLDGSAAATLRDADVRGQFVPETDALT